MATKKENVEKPEKNTDKPKKIKKMREKVVKKLTKKNKKDEAQARITNDTVVDHRKKILADGRKFKYPLQYSKHKILINVIIISIVALISFSVWLWAMLYRVQATGDFFYSAVRILPLPVANVDGYNVPYSKYLRRLRANIFFKEQFEGRDFSTEDGKRELNFIRRQELNNAIKATYAARVARENNISVSDEELEREIERSLVDDSGARLTLEEFERNTLRKYYNWSLDDYREVLRSQMLIRKVIEKIETFEDDLARLFERNLIREHINVPEIEE